MSTTTSRTRSPSAHPTLHSTRRPVLGAFALAGFPDEKGGVDALLTYAHHGAGLLEVGVPTSNPWLDGPDISAAHHHALRHEHGMRTVVATVRQVSAATRRPIVVMSYWSSVRAYGPQRLADTLAEAGVSGCMVPDLPSEHAARWRGAAASAGIEAPVLADRAASAQQLAAGCRAATGFVYAPASCTPTGYQGALDLTSLAGFVESIRRVAPWIPVVTGIGVSTPELASAIVRQVDISAVVIGSPLVRALLRGDTSLRRTAALVREFATAVAAPQARG